MRDKTACPTAYDIASWILMATALLLVLLLHLLPGLVVGLATYELVQLLVKFLKIVQIHQIRAKLAAVSLVALGVVTAIVGATVGLISFLQTDNIPALLSKLADSLHRGTWPRVIELRQKVAQRSDQSDVLDLHGADSARIHLPNKKRVAA